MKAGDLVRYRRFKGRGVFILLDWKRGDCWATAVYLQDGKEYIELIVAFEVVDEGGRFDRDLKKILDSTGQT